MALHIDNIHLTQVNKNFFLSTKGRTFWPRGFWNDVLTGGVAKTRVRVTPRLRVTGDGGDEGDPHPPPSPLVLPLPSF